MREKFKDAGHFEFESHLRCEFPCLVRQQYQFLTKHIALNRFYRCVQTKISIESLQ